MHAVGAGRAKQFDAYWESAREEIVATTEVAIRAYLSALKEDPEVVERVARAMFDDEIQANPKRDPEKTWKDEDLIWLSNARAALSALEVPHE